MAEVNKNLLAAALEWAELGIPVFPVMMPSKRPLTKNGFKDASTEPEVVASMFASADVGGIGAAMGHGLFAIDADIYKPGEAGESAKRYINELSQQGLLPDTRVHHTVSGGVHYIFQSDDAPTCNPTLGVEVKGLGGYIVLPPTPGYKVVREGVVEAPAALVQQIKAKRSAAKATTVDVLRQRILSADDFHESITQLSAKLAATGMDTADIAAEVNGLLAASVASNPNHPRHARWKGLVSDSGKELSRAVTSSHKFNPDTPEKLLREIAAGQGLFGGMASKGWKEGPSETHSADLSDPNTFPFVTGYFGHEQLEILNQTYVAYPILADGETVVISAKPKAGKTLIAQTLGMHIAAGADLGDIKIEESRPVLYFSLEGQVTVRRRLMAWKRSVDEDNTKLTEDTFPFYVSERPINLLKEEVREAFADCIVQADRFWKAKGFASLGAAIIDTLTKAMPGGKQNDVEDTSAVFDVIGRIRAKGCDVPVIFIHHDSKAGDTRGSSNIQAEPDTLFGVEALPDEDRIDLVVRMARNIEGHDTWSFRAVNVNLGTSAQGYSIQAPVAVPLTKIDMEAERGTAVEADLVAASRKAKALGIIASMGVGMRTVKMVHEHLSRTLPADEYPINGQRPQSRSFMDYFMGLIPKTGITVDGMNIHLNASVSKVGRKEVVKLESISVRAISQAATG